MLGIVLSLALATVHITFDAGSRLDARGKPGVAFVASRVIANRLPDFEGDINVTRSLFTIETDVDVRERVRAALRARVTREEFERAMQVNAKDDVLLQLIYGMHDPSFVSPAVELRDVQRFIRAHYDASLSQRMRCRPVITRLSHERVQRVRGEHHEIHWGYPTAPAGTRDWLALNLLADILGQGPESRLQKKLAHFGEGESEWPCGSSLFRMRARLAPDEREDEVLKIVDEEIDRFARELVSDEELQRAKEQERAWAAEQMASPASAASSRARGILFYGDPDRVTSDADTMASITAGEIRAAARRYLGRENRAVVIQGGKEP